MGRAAWGAWITRFRRVGAGVGLGLVLASPAQATPASRTHESPGVRAVLSHQLQQAGPSVVSEGAYGGSGDSSTPNGELVPSLSSEFADTWRTKHGPLVTRIFDAPVNFRGAHGWQAIDDNLVTNPLGGYKNTANRFSLEVSGGLASAVSLTSQAGTVSFSLQGALSTIPAVSANTATLPEVLPATDVSYRSESAGVSELAKLKGTRAPTSLRYALSVSSGLTPRLEPGGSIALIDQQGSVAFTIPLRWPSSPASRPNRGTCCR